MVQMLMGNAIMSAALTAVVCLGIFVFPGAANSGASWMVAQRCGKHGGKALLEHNHLPGWFMTSSGSKSAMAKI